MVDSLPTEMRPMTEQETVCTYASGRRGSLAAAVLFCALFEGCASGDGESAAPKLGAPLEYYVSPSGSDSNPGTLSAPFLTLSHAQSVMRVPGNAKRLYLRVGTYSSVPLTFTPADSGEIWTYYPPDGYNSAILDGGSVGMRTGVNVITIDGTSDFTVDGLLIQNFRNWGIGIHGGPADPVGGFPTEAPTAVNVTIMNNIVNNGYTDNTSGANLGWSGGGIWASGSTTNLHILNNVITNQYGSGIRVIPTDTSGTTNPNGNYNGLTISNNVCLITDQATGDNGAIYIQDTNFDSANITISNNFIRDYQANPSLRSAAIPIRDVAIYLDEGASNTTVTGNIVANTAYAVTSPGPSTISTTAFYMSTGHNDTWSGNIADLGTLGIILNANYELHSTSDPAMSGNSFTNNIFVGNWSGPQESYGSSYGPYAYASTANLRTLDFPTVTHNMYYNYGSGSLSTTGPQFGDAEPTTNINPQVSGLASQYYAIASGSAAFANPVNFPGIAGNWGPPGYVIPATGTPPSPQIQP